jgi:ribosomal protein S18 acetylase RimI-like enzyme
MEKRLSCNEIKLRVAHGNKRALALYKKIGFSITGYNMIKKIIGDNYEVLEIKRYTEMEEDDSMYVILRLK